MASKLVVATFKDEPRWHLDGVPVEGEHVVASRDGIEIHGRIVCDGPEPPGRPIFTWLLAGETEAQRVEIRPETDTFRRASAQERDRGSLPHPIRRLH
jgi:hypothetical protein